MHKTGPFTNSGVSKFVKLVAVYTKHQQLNNTKNNLIKMNWKLNRLAPLGGEMDLETDEAIHAARPASRARAPHH